MSVTIVSADRLVLRECEAAEAHAEACRQDWLKVLNAPRISMFAIEQSAISYAEAANAAKIARNKYEEMIMAEMEKDLGR